MYGSGGAAERDLRAAGSASLVEEVAAEGIRRATTQRRQDGASGGRWRREGKRAIDDAAED